MSATPTPEEINRVIHGYEMAKNGADYADTIVCEIQQIEGTNFRMVWSTEYDGPFEPNN